MLEDQMKRGGYPTPDDVIRAGIASVELHGAFEPGELDRLLAEGEADVAAGHLHDGEAFFRQLDESSAARRQGRTP